MTEIGQPQFLHDCGQCEYIGTVFRAERLGYVDHYYCLHDPKRGGNVVARYSSDGPDYSSGHLSNLGKQEDLWKSFRDMTYGGNHAELAVLFSRMIQLKLIW